MVETGEEAFLATRADDLATAVTTTAGLLAVTSLGEASIVDGAVGDRRGAGNTPGASRPGKNSNGETSLEAAMLLFDGETGVAAGETNLAVAGNIGSRLYAILVVGERSDNLRMEKKKTRVI
jgi:hypothetical protein